MSKENGMARFQVGGCTVYIPIILSIVASLLLTLLLSLLLNC